MGGRELHPAHRRPVPRPAARGLGPRPRRRDPRQHRRPARLRRHQVRRRPAGALHPVRHPAGRRRRRRQPAPAGLHPRRDLRPPARPGPRPAQRDAPHRRPRPDGLGPPPIPDRRRTPMALAAHRPRHRRHRRRGRWPAHGDRSSRRPTAAAAPRRPADRPQSAPDVAGTDTIEPAGPPTTAGLRLPQTPDSADGPAPRRARGALRPPRPRPRRPDAGPRPRPDRHRPRRATADGTATGTADGDPRDGEGGAA